MHVVALDRVDVDGAFPVARLRAGGRKDELAVIGVTDRLLKADEEGVRAAVGLTHGKPLDKLPRDAAAEIGVGERLCVGEVPDAGGEDVHVGHRRPARRSPPPDDAPSVPEPGFGRLRLWRRGGSVKCGGLRRGGCGRRGCGMGAAGQKKRQCEQYSNGPVHRISPFSSF